MATTLPAAPAAPAIRRIPKAADILAFLSERMVRLDRDVASGAPVHSRAAHAVYASPGATLEEAPPLAMAERAEAAGCPPSATPRAPANSRRPPRQRCSALH